MGTVGADFLWFCFAVFALRHTDESGDSEWCLHSNTTRVRAGFQSSFQVESLLFFGQELAQTKKASKR